MAVDAVIGAEGEFGANLRSPSLLGGGHSHGHSHSHGHYFSCEPPPGEPPPRDPPAATDQPNPPPTPRDCLRAQVEEGDHLQHRRRSQGVAWTMPELRGEKQKKQTRERMGLLERETNKQRRKRECRASHSDPHRRRPHPCLTKCCAAAPFSRSPLSTKPSSPRTPKLARFPSSVRLRVSQSR
ncbi:hypothetical protein TIFTF001_036042 [Ficus carica]|uniref:Uncharacterized protein n=1 Tax=Ficus carica TaxID=3494 RepID=A0AA88JAA1_FICCA|nr:hypothetical protein TIFTF001_036042 [Ficus carica]